MNYRKKNDVKHELSLPRGPVMVDIEGFDLLPHERERLLNPNVGGVILFRRNFQSIEQIRALCKHIHELRSPELIIAVDHEGGRVQRFLEGFTRLPPMRTLGEQYDVDPSGALDLARQVGEVLATELRAVGVDLSFAPVLDTDWARSGIIGDRAFSSDPEKISVLAKAVCDGLAQGGMASCGKHFPGHGWVIADSHHAIPIDERDLETLYAHDLKPFFELIAHKMESIMPAHVIYPSIDSQPAGFSTIWLQTILRKQLGFDGLIFSDDLCMEGAAGAGGIVERAHAALAAGCDMVLVCNRPDLADELLHAFEGYKIAPTLAARLEKVEARGTPEAAERKMNKAEFEQMQAKIANFAMPPEQLKHGVNVGEAY